MNMVVTLGAAAIDMAFRVDRFPGPDEIVIAKEGPYMFPGGSTANIAVGLARLGVPSRFIGKVGGDANGKSIIESFEAEGVETRFIRTEQTQRTAQTIIAVDQQGKRIIFSLGGTAILDNPDEFSVEMIEGAGILYVGEVWPDVGERVMRAANDLGITVVYGPGGIFSDLGVKQLGRMLSAAEYVILSRRELGILTKRTRENEGVLSLLEAGAKRLVVTLGRDGAALFEASGNRNGDEMGFIKQSQEGFEATAVDTTGAGDAFTAGFVRGLAGGMNLMECLIIGNACGSLAIAKMGPREAMPSWKEVSEFIHFHQERAGDHDS